MNITTKENFSVDLYGFSGVAMSSDRVATAMTLMNKMWQEVKSNNLKNKGINIWVYDQKNNMFAGVELESTPQPDSPLQHKKIHLPRYAYYKHIGPYDRIKETCSKVLHELNQRGLRIWPPYLEIYGHWTNDESKLETELIWNLE